MNMSSSDVPWQLCQSLLDLQEAVDGVFNTIVTRVNMENEQLKNLMNRIQLAQDKVKAISLSKQATTVFSSTKYPNLPSEALDFTPLFGNDSEPFFVKLSPHLGCCGESGEGTLELFRFFMETNEEHWFNSQKMKEGIGSLPPEVKCVPDILLFNSTELPFHSYRSADNLGEVEAQQADYNHRKTATKLPAPPQSILESNTSLLTSSGRQKYGFRPVLRQVPTFSLPATLPNLSMVANISWNDGSKFPFDGVSYIAPSAMYGPSLGTIETSSTPILVSGPSIQVDALNVSTGQGQGPSTSLVKAPSLSVTAATKEALNGKDYSPPRPPPMPPVPGPGSFISIIPEGKLQRNSPVLHPSAPMEAVGPSLPPRVDSQRAALMASIRNPGIVLRKTSFTDDSLSQHAIKDIRDGEQSSLSRKQAGDFLAEMAASLKMRRLSMQGHSTNKSADLDANSKDGNPAYPESRRRINSPLPIMNFRDFIVKENNDSGDDWDDNSD